MPLCLFGDCPFLCDSAKIATLQEENKKHKLSIQGHVRASSRATNKIASKDTQILDLKGEIKVFKTAAKDAKKAKADAAKSIRGVSPAPTPPHCTPAAGANITAALREGRMDGRKILFIETLCNGDGRKYHSVLSDLVEAEPTLYKPIETRGEERCLKKIKQAFGRYSGKESSVCTLVFRNPPPSGQLLSQACFHTVLRLSCRFEPQPHDQSRYYDLSVVYVRF